MFSFGWSEIFLISVIVIIVVGPKELPNFLRQIAKLSKSIKKLSNEFKSSLNEISEDVGLDDINKSIKDVRNIEDRLNIKKHIEKEIDEVEDTISLVKKDTSDIKKSN